MPVPTQAQLSVITPGELALADELEIKLNREIKLSWNGDTQLTVTIECTEPIPFRVSQELERRFTVSGSWSTFRIHSRRLNHEAVNNLVPVQLNK